MRLHPLYNDYFMIPEKVLQLNEQDSGESSILYQWWNGEVHGTKKGEEEKKEVTHHILY